MAPFASSCPYFASVITAAEPLILRAKTHKPNDFKVWTLVNNSEFPEILVEGDKNLAVLERVYENLVVAGIAQPVSDRFDLVPGSAECFAGASPAPLLLALRLVGLAACDDISKLRGNAANSAASSLPCGYPQAIHTAVLAAAVWIAGVMVCRCTA